MPSTYNTAYQETMKVLYDGLQANNSYKNLTVEWPNVKQKKPTDVAEETANANPFIRVTFQHVDRQQRTVGSANGKRRYENFVLLTVSLYVASGYGLEEIATFVNYIQSLFEGQTTASGVIFRKGAPRDIGQEGHYYRSDALIDLQYDEIV